MFSNFDKKIIELSLNGYSSREIVDMLPGSNESTINSFINTLNKVNHPNYNPKIYNKILMEKFLKVNNVIDKDLIFKVADMILEGYLPIEIAVLNNLNEQSFNKIIYNIKSLTYLDEQKVSKVKEKLHAIINLNTITKFHRILKLEKQFPNIKLEDYGFELNHYRHWQENIKLVDEFLNTNIDLTTLALKHNVTKTTVRNLLTGNDSSNFLKNNFDKNTCERVLNLYYERINEENRKIDFKPKKAVDSKIISITKNCRFWILFILTFRISINDLAKMFKIDDVKKLHENIFMKAGEMNSIYLRALKYLDCNSNSDNLDVVLSVIVFICIPYQVIILFIAFVS